MTLAMIQWSGWELWPAAAAAAAILLAAVAWLYPGQVTSLGGGWRWTLPVLRVAALGALTLSILRPVLIRTKTIEEQGVVLVLVDRSASMGVRDYASADGGLPAPMVGQLVSIGESLGRIAPEARARLAARLYDEVLRIAGLAEDIQRAQREVEYARLSGRDPADATGRLDKAIAALVTAAREAEQNARQARLPLVDTLSKLARPSGDRTAWISRLDKLVERARDDAQAAQDQVDVEKYREDETVRQVVDELSHQTRLRLAWESLVSSGGLTSTVGRDVPLAAFAVGDEAVPLTLRAGFEADATLEADGARTDLVGGIRQAIRQLGRRPVQAVVVFSDGRHNGPDQSLPPGLLPQGVPVFAVSTASETARDLSVLRADVPTSVFAGETLDARLTVRNAGFDPRRLAGRAGMAVDGRSLASAPLRVRDKRVEAELSARLDEPGVRKVELSVPVQGNELSLMNNTVTRWVKVLGQRVRIAAVSGAPSWDHRYVRDALARTPWVELREAIVVPGVSGLAMSPAEILGQDLVLLNDVPREALTQEQWQAVLQLVQQRGGSVIVVPGLTHVRQQAQGDPLAELMPYRSSARAAWRTWPGQAPYFHVAPAPGVDDLSLLRLEQESDQSRRRWDELPAFYRYLALPELRPGVRELLVERESRSPILTESRHGAGRAFLFAMNETWRWRTRIGERDQDRFWLQLVRHAIDEPYAIVSDGLGFDVDRVSAVPGEAVNVRARVAGDPAALPPQLELLVMSEGRVRERRYLTPTHGGADGRYSTRLSDLPTGGYELKLLGPAGAGGMLQELPLPLEVTRDDELEMGDLTGDRPFLQNLADATGGRVLGLERVQELPRLLSDARARLPRVSEVPLWNSKWLFVFVVSCLSAEWALRKRFGLA